MNRFGALLAESRLSAGASQDALALELGISRAYISDLELGRRGPLNPDAIERAGIFLGVDPRDMRRAAILDRGSVCLDVSGDDSPMRIELAARLGRDWRSLTPYTISQLIGALD